MEKLEKYADSENIFNRQMVARTVLETLRQVLEDKEDNLAEDVVRVFNVVELLARDTEPSVSISWESVRLPGPDIITENMLTPTSSVVRLLSSSSRPGWGAVTATLRA